MGDKKKPYVTVVTDLDTGQAEFEYGNGLSRESAIALLRTVLAQLDPPKVPFVAPVSPFRTDT